MMALTISNIQQKLATIDWTLLPKPARNKGERGLLLETALGIPKSSALLDMDDGELKTYTIGETIAVTQLKHCLPEILETKIPFEQSKVGQKLEQTIYVGFSKTNQYIGTVTLNKESDPVHYQYLAEDYQFICDKICNAYELKLPLSTITGPNCLLQIRTKATKSTTGSYVPLLYNGHQFKDKGMAFYVCSKFGRCLF